jgi:RNA-binding protein YhbY
MCGATNLLDKLEDIVETVDKEQSKLSRQLSQCDKLISEYYHKIEQEEFDEKQGNQMLKQLQKALRKRRLIKIEMDNYKLLSNQVHIKKIGLGNIKGARKVIRRSKIYIADWDIDELNNDGFKVY